MPRRSDVREVHVMTRKKHRKTIAVRGRRQRPAGKASGFARAVLESLQNWERGDPVTIRHVAAIPRPRALSADEVKRIRTELLGVSQAVFAQLLGVSVKLVEAWEAGRNKPAGAVCRLFELIKRDPRGFLRRYVKGAA
jgi:DNA-binding transcriptional regulator YiaG